LSGYKGNTPFNKSQARSRKPEDPIRDNIVSNEGIRHLEVRVIDDDGTQLGVMPTRQAMWQAREKGLDLIEITKDSNPPVVKIVDLNKWVYNLRRNKKEQDRKARENAIVMKEIQLKPVTALHDIEIKQEHARQFLAEAAKVRVLIKFKGRERYFSQKGFEVMQTFLSGLGECKIEKHPEMKGDSILAIIAPSPVKKP
jgi:translation initiation factor IF-3